MSSTACLKVFDLNVGRSGLSAQQAGALGLAIETTAVSAPDKPHYYPGAKPAVLKLVAERGTRRLLGIQGVGLGEVVKRIDVAIAAMAGRLTVQRTVHNETNLPRNWKLTVEAPPDLTITVPKHVQVPRNGAASFDITVDARNVPLGEVRHASIEFKQGNEYLHFPVTIVRQQAAVLMDKVCEPAQLPVGGTTDCTITIENTASTPAEVVVVDQLPDRLSLIPDSVVGAQPEGNNRLVFAGSLMGATPGLRLDDTVPLYGYLPLSAYGFTPIPPPSNADDGAYLISGLDFVYQVVQYTDAIWSVNGTLEIGTASGLAASAANGLMPDATPPNNLLAAWWTDLDLSTGGEWYMGALSDGVNVYDIFEWSNLARFADPSSTASFQIWLARGTNLAWFTYGGFTGDTADGTVGVENANGTVGYTYYSVSYTHLTLPTIYSV